MLLTSNVLPESLAAAIDDAVSGYLHSLPPAPVFLTAEDASSLHAIESGSVDVLVQDALLNRAPHCLHEAIMEETARVLRPGALAFIGFTDHQGLGARFRLRHPRPGARIQGLRELPPALREGLFQDAVLLEADPARLTLVTAPSGNFEFYFPCQWVTNLYQRQGLEPLVHRQWRSGAWQRHSMLLRKRG